VSAARVHNRDEAVAALAEVFREHGFEGASLTLISARTGLGKGSLYNYFPGGKEEMAATVLAEIDHWFETHIFAPLRDDDDPRHALAHMLDAVDRYFRSGRRLCLVGVLALGDARDLFAKQVSGYFIAWADALAACLVRAGHDRETAKAIAEEALATIQGALILTRATPKSGIFGRAMTRLKERLLAPLS
jgi:AcrR family transcriptional regulator